MSGQQNYEDAAEPGRSTVIRRRFFDLGIFVLSLLGLALSNASTAGANDVQVDDPATTYPANPSVAVGDAGETVFVWAETWPDPEREVFARLFDGSGQPRGQAFQVNEVTTSYQSYPQAAVTDSGGFVIVWESLTGDAEAGIKARRYDSSGQPVGGEYAIQTANGLTERTPSLSKSPDGTFVVGWNVRQDSLRGRRLDADGVPIGNEITFAADPAMEIGHHRPQNADVDIFFAWGRIGFDFAGRLFDAAGAPLGSEMSFPDTDGFSLNFSPAVAWNGDRFLAAWCKSDPFGVRGRLFDSDGDAIGADFEIPNASCPEATAIPGGDFQLAWMNSAGLFTNRVTPTGELPDENRKVNLAALGDHREPQVTARTDGDIVFVWRAQGPTVNGVFTRTLTASPDIFADGFESGDTAAWTSTVP